MEIGATAAQSVAAAVGDDTNNGVYIVINSQTPYNPEDRFPVGLVKKLSVVQIVLGSVAIVTQLAITSLDSAYDYTTGEGVYCGVFFVASGAAGFFTIRRITLASVTFFMVMNVVAPLAGAVLLFMSGCMLDDAKWWHRNSEKYGHATFVEMHVLYSVQIVAGLCEGVIGVVCSAICCRSSGCCGASGTPTEAEAYPINVVRLFSSAEILSGLLTLACFGLAFVSFKGQSTAEAVFCGMAYLVTGLVGVLTTVCRLNRCSYTAVLICSIVSMFFGFVHIMFSGLRIHNIVDRARKRQEDTWDQEDCDKQQLVTFNDTLTSEVNSNSTYVYEDPCHVFPLPENYPIRVEGPVTFFSFQIGFALLMEVCALFISILCCTSCCCRSDAVASSAVYYPQDIEIDNKKVVVLSRQRQEVRSQTNEGSTNYRRL